MPNRPVHVSVAAPLGFGYAALKAHNQKGLSPLVEGLGGLLSAVTGGVLPDLIDPPDHPGHRSIAHGLAPVGTTGILWAHNLDSWQARLRQLADHHQRQRMQAKDAFVMVWHAIAEWALRLLAGFLAGIGVGYLSHIVLDFQTPRCIPLIS